MARQFSCLQTCSTPHIKIQKPPYRGGVSLFWQVKKMCVECVMIRWYGRTSLTEAAARHHALGRRRPSNSNLRNSQEGCAAAAQAGSAQQKWLSAAGSFFGRGRTQNTRRFEIIIASRELLVMILILERAEGRLRGGFGTTAPNNKNNSQ